MFLKNLRSQLAERQDLWQGLTRRTRWQADIGGGYDNNLNGGPRSDRIALTLSGEPIFLALSEEYRAASGGFANLGILAEQIRLAWTCSISSPDVSVAGSAKMISPMSLKLRADTAAVELGLGAAPRRAPASATFGGKACSLVPTSEED